MSKKDNKIIVIDCRSIRHPLTGVGRYTFEIISNIPKEKLKYKFLLLSHERINIKNKNFIYKCSDLNNKILRFLWSNIYISFYLRKIRPSVFWSTCHRYPFFLGSYKKILTVHDFVWQKFPETMNLSNYILDRFFMPIAIKKSHKIFTVSENTTNDLVLFRPEAKGKVITIPLTSKFNKGNYDLNDVPVNVIKICKKYKFILFVGTFEPRKNLQNLISAFLESSEVRYNSVNLLIVGAKGWGKRLSDKSIITHPNFNKIFFLNYLSDNSLSYLYSKALFFAYPSLYEGYGLPIIEAISHGKAILTSNISSMPEVARNSGYYVDPNSIKSIKKAINKLISNKNLLISLEDNSKKRKLSSWADITKKKLDIIINTIAD
jgi:glycosyltransferase involved in cell wall biosynthesis